MAKPALAAVPAADAAAPAKKKKSKLLPIIIALLVLGGAGGGGAWWFFGRAHDAAEPKVAKVTPPVFHTLDPFTVNLTEENGDHYLQVSIVYQVADSKFELYVGQQVDVFIEDLSERDDEAAVEPKEPFVNR